MEYDRPQFFRVMKYASEADRDVVNMASGSPDWEPPEALREGLDSYADAPPEQFQYPPSVGLTELREEIAARRGVECSQVIITNGTGEANHLAMTEGYQTMPGEEILLVDPVYPYYAGRATLLGAETAYVSATDAGYLDPDTVAKQASSETSVIVINSPNNPLGVTYERETIHALVEIAQRHDAVLVSDEVYDHFDYTDRFESALAVDSPNRIVTNAFSKSMGITGWRVGYAIFPDPDGPTGELLQSARTRHMLTNVACSRPAQAAVLHALRNTGPEYYQQTRETIQARIQTLTDGLDSLGVRYIEPDGAFYVMASFPDFPGSFENVERLIDEAGVAGMPGEAFGGSRSEWIRFALVTSRVETAVDRLVSFFE